MLFTVAFAEDDENGIKPTTDLIFFYLLHAVIKQNKNKTLTVRSLMFSCNGLTSILST